MVFEEINNKTYNYQCIFVIEYKLDLNLVWQVPGQTWMLIHPSFERSGQTPTIICGLPEASVCKMEITVPLTLDILIDRIYAVVDWCSLETSIWHDTTASEPIQARWAPNVGGKTHLIQARQKDMCLFLHFPIHTRWAAKQTLLVWNRCRLMF